MYYLMCVESTAIIRHFDFNIFKFASNIVSFHSNIFAFKTISPRQNFEIFFRS